MAMGQVYLNQAKGQVAVPQVGEMIAEEKSRIKEPNLRPYLLRNVPPWWFLQCLGQPCSHVSQGSWG